MTIPEQPKDSKHDVKERYSYGDHLKTAFMERSSQSHASFFTPYIRSGMSLLDCGCGPGTITLDLAEIVAPGEVFGFDVNDTGLTTAKELATSRGITNVRFDKASIYSIPVESASVDAVFVHAVLHHLSEPVTALSEITRVLKPGGVIGIREPDFDGTVRGPSDAPGAILYELWPKMLQYNGGNAYLGRDLRKLMHDTGFKNVIATASYETHGTPETIEFERTVAGDSLTPSGALGEGLLEYSLIDEKGLAKLRQEILDWCDDPGAFLARNWCEAVGWKASKN